MELAHRRPVRTDLILIDSHFPRSLGLEVTKWLKEDEDLRQIPVVAVTAFAMKGDEEAHSRGRLRGLPLEADLGGEVSRDGSHLCRRRVTGGT